MQRVTEQVDAAYLQQSPPRPLSPAVMANLLSDHVFEHPLKAFFDPLIIAGIITLLVLFALHTSTPIRLVPVLLIVIRLQEFRYADATSIAVVMLVASFLIIFAVNRLQRWAQTRIPAH